MIMETKLQIDPRPHALRVQAPVMLAGIACVALATLGPSLHERFGAAAFWVVIVAHAAIAAWVCLNSDHRAQRETLIIILILAVAMRVPQLWLTPYLSDDIYRYVWDGRVQGAGINPYRYVPTAPELSSLRDAAVYPFINRAHYAPTIYPPGAQIFFWLVTRFGDSLLVMKLGLLACEALGIAATLVILNRLSLPLTRSAALAWHPLAIWEIVGSGHIDGAMVGVMILGVALYAWRPLLAGSLIALAALMKPIAIVVLPAFWRPWDWKLPTIVAATLFILYVPYLAVGTKVFGFLSGYLAEEGLRAGDGFRYMLILQNLVGPIPNAAIVYAALAAALMLTLALNISWRTSTDDKTAIASATVLLATFLILLTPHYPWYYLALVPFLTVYPTSATLWLLTVGGVQTYQNYSANVPDYDTRQIVFHSLVLVATARDTHVFKPWHALHSVAQTPRVKTA